jgi:CheY-like chemotaxis protein
MRANIDAVARRTAGPILMDILMDGYEATRRIRINPDLNSVPIIAVRVGR